MKYIKMFISGLAFPSTLIPFLLCFAEKTGRGELLTIPFIHFLPILWGLWNILYFLVFIRFFPEKESLSISVAGAILGLLVAIYGIFWLHIPEVVGIPSLHYLPLIAAPILYAIFWRFIVQPLNHLLNVERD